jgi:CheY-like chemotaxis protein
MKRLLLIDDDDDFREILCDALAFGGYEITCAASGHAALEWLARHGAPDLILLDLMMPRMSGSEVKSRLDADPALRGVPVVLLSGDTHLAELGRAMGAAAWISKPTTLEKLTAVIEHHIGPGSARRCG